MSFDLGLMCITILGAIIIVCRTYENVARICATDEVDEVETGPNLQRDEIEERLDKIATYQETQLQALNFIVDFINKSQQPRTPT